ncbi:hypothetical protein [Sedimentitalea todarodis]|uniref:Uncharacterized protein n=1 Tax=Sedimentitalea todarodis TaxID=1631240 RepID=A0ABU3VAT0_9RHOB|nr:hypothetical protein [Sedimentitalea todarodis]MDU9003281.1 hypothetical protein [Sedimentitalea todarodis]
MKVPYVPAAVILSALAVAGCAPSPADYETTPVQVKTAQGVVTCQLYTPERVLWDRAIDRPNSMSVQQGDAVCRAEGERRKNS